MLTLLLNTTLPILLIAVLSALVGARVRLDTQTLSRSTIYLFTPALTLYALLETEMALREAGTLILAGFLVCVLLALVSAVLARGLPLDRRQTSSFVLVVFIMNSGNFGLPFNEFAFGLPGLQRAVVFGIGVALAINSLGVYVASLGESNVRVAVTNVLRNPLPYSVIVGIGIKGLSLSVPLFLSHVITLLGQAAVPIQLIILGLQLRHILIETEGAPWRLVMLAAASRFGLGLLVGMGVVALLGLGGLSRQVVLLQAAMPAGIFSGVLAVEYGSDANFTAATVLVTTSAAVILLPLLLLSF